MVAGFDIGKLFAGRDAAAVDSAVEDGDQRCRAFDSLEIARAGFVLLESQLAGVVGADFDLDIVAEQRKKVSA